MKQTLLKALAAAAALGVVGLLAVVSANEQASHQSSFVSAAQFARPVTITGAPLAPLPVSGVDPAVGTLAPAIDGVDLDGNLVQLGAGKQAIVLVASWCPACQQELRDLAELDRGGLLPTGLPITLVLTLHDDARPNWPADRWLARERWTRPVLVDDLDSSAAFALGLQATPTWILIERDGSVAHRHAGVWPAQAIVELLAGFDQS